VTDFLIRRTEPGPQQLGDMTTQRLVPWPAGKRAHQFGKSFAMPGRAHARTMREWIGPAKPVAKRAEAAISRLMSVLQADLFGTPSREREQPNDEIVALVRRRLHATLALVKAADTMPWPDLLSIIREDNAFRFGKDVLPREEGMALWAEFDAEMNRLYAIMNEGKEQDLGD
jgi:hypothetical protein